MSIDLLITGCARWSVLELVPVSVSVAGVPTSVSVPFNAAAFNGGSICTTTVTPPGPWDRLNSCDTPLKTHQAAIQTVTSPLLPISDEIYQNRGETTGGDRRGR